MLRWVPLLAAATIFVVGPAIAADMPNSRNAGSSNAIYGKAPRHGRTAHVKEDSDLLFTPSEGMPDVTLPPRTPLLLGSATLPGYYGSNHSYDDQGPYYGGPNIDYRFRLPYACGVVGYC